MNKRSRIRERKAFALFFLLGLLSWSSCVSHLKEAKFYYTQGKKFSRQYQTEKAISSFKKALSEAELEVSRHPSIQAYLLKGMAELNLKQWKMAEQSFLNAFDFGFEKGEEWARQLSLLGLAISLEAYKLEDYAFEVYTYLVDKSRLRPVTMLAAQKYTDKILKEGLQSDQNERQGLLGKALKTAKKLTSKDMSCGYYHYLQSQIQSHFSDYIKSFEEAVIAKELGLHTEEIMRDNDLQIIFCYQMLRENLTPQDWSEFHPRYMDWVRKWDWKGPETPDWKKEAKNASRD